MCVKNQYIFILEIFLLQTFDIYFMYDLFLYTLQDARFCCAYIGLQQLIQHPTRIPDRHNHQPNILDLFLTSNLSQYSYKVLPPLGSSDHNLISVKCNWAPPPPIPPSKRHIWHFDRARWTDLRSFFLEFPWSASCFSSRDASVIADSVSGVIVAGMESCIPNSTKSTTSAKWFDCSCSNAIEERTWRCGLFEVGTSSTSTSTSASKEKEEEGEEECKPHHPNSPRDFPRGLPFFRLAGTCPPGCPSC